MQVPLLDVNAQNLALEAELTAAFQRVLRSGQFIMGPEVEAFEAECAALSGTSHAIGCSSGTDAILLALMALGIGPGDEVLVPTFTFFATAGCVARTGATPVFVDSCPVCFNMDPGKAAAKVTDRTRAVIPVHLFGQSAEMDAILSLARDRRLSVIEDGAQAIGARYRGAAVGSLGDFGTYSFFPSKNLGGFGDGGMLVTNDERLAERARLLRVHGSKPKYYHRLIGGNFRLDPLQAAMLRVKLRHYGEYTARRQANANRYQERLSALPGVAVAEGGRSCPGSLDACSGSGVPRIILPLRYAHNEHIWNQYTLRITGPGNRDKLKKYLGSCGIGCEIYYPVTMDRQECFSYTSEMQRGGCEVAHRLADEVISLPIFPELSEPQGDAVIRAVSGFLSSH